MRKPARPSPEYRPLHGMLWRVPVVLPGHRSPGDQLNSAARCDIELGDPGVLLVERTLPSGAPVIDAFVPSNSPHRLRRAFLNVWNVEPLSTGLKILACQPICAAAK